MGTTDPLCNPSSTKSVHVCRVRTPMHTCACTHPAYDDTEAQMKPETFQVATTVLSGEAVPEGDGHVN